MNDLDVSADYIERLLDETRNALPQVFLEPELPSVREELGTLGELSNRFRATCKVSRLAGVVDRRHSWVERFVVEERGGERARSEPFRDTPNRW